MEETSEELYRRLGNFAKKDETAIYTNFNYPNNMKPRVIYCQYCKYYVNTAMVAAQCKKCNSDMITL